MRVLCLHGAGTSAEIFTRQTSALRYQLRDDHIEFVFADGEYSASPAPEISDLYPGPYFSYYDWEPYEAPVRPPMDSLADAHEYLELLLQPAERGGMGPFDGLLGFSQGAALIMSYLLWHSSSKTGDGDPAAGVRFAAFFCGSRPWNREGTTRLCVKDMTMPKLNIPTMHVLGAKDIWREESRQLLAMCDAKEVVSWEHDQGHVIPMDTKSSQRMSDMFRKVVRRAQFQ